MNEVMLLEQVTFSVRPWFSRHEWSSLNDNLVGVVGCLGFDVHKGHHVAPQIHVGSFQTVSEYGKGHAFPFG